MHCEQVSSQNALQAVLWAALHWTKPLVFPEAFGLSLTEEVPISVAYLISGSYHSILSRNEE